MGAFNSKAQEEAHKGKVIFAVNTTWGIGYYADANGRFLFKRQFEEVDAFSCGLAKVRINGRYGYINTSGELVIPCIYDTASPFVDGLAEVSKGLIYGCIDANGNEIIPLQYSEIYQFSDGVAVVKQNDRYGVMGKVLAC
jgi:hypothetical protein